MTKFLNLKIPVENNLDEIVVELERLGYKKDLEKGNSWILCHEFGLYSLHSHKYGFGNLTTLAELKEMK